jgi:hypothetical protein
MYICVCYYLLPVPKTSGFVALFYWKMFMLVMLELPPFIIGFDVMMLLLSFRAIWNFEVRHK